MVSAVVWKIGVNAYALSAVLCLICEKLPRKRHTKTRSPVRTQTLRSSRDLMHLRVLSHHEVDIASKSNPGQFAPNNMDHALPERCTRSFGNTAVHVETAAQTMFFRSGSLHHVSESCSKNRRHKIDTKRFDTLKTPTTTDPDLFPCLWTMSVCRVPAESTFPDVFFFLTTGTSCFCAVAYGVARKFHVRPGSRTSRGRSSSTSFYLVVPHTCLTVRPWVRLRFSSCPSSSSCRRRTHDPPNGGGKHRYRPPADDEWN